MSFTIRRSILVVVVSLAVVAAGVLVAQRASAVSATPVVYVATGENFPDALGAAGAAAVQGGPVLLVQKDTIPAVTKAELSRLKPGVIYVSGGTAVVSDAVFNALKAYAPTVTRVAGANRYATAVEVSKSAFPVAATGGGDTAALEAAFNALAARVDALEAENTAMAARVSDLDADNTAMAARVSDLEADNTAMAALLAGVSRDGSTLLFTGMNVQVVNGEGQTDSKNTLGNLVIGYNAWTAGGTSFRDGSHYLVIGDEHQYRSWGGIVAGYENTASGSNASVTGGAGNTASGTEASVTGGYGNTASGNGASVTGGFYNIASEQYSSVTGGRDNTASGGMSSVNGGYLNTASGGASSVSGGDDIVCNPSTHAMCGEGAIVPPD